jgi:hypothetical protein
MGAPPAPLIALLTASVQRNILITRNAAPWTFFETKTRTRSLGPISVKSSRRPERNLARSLIIESNDPTLNGE